MKERLLDQEREAYPQFQCSIHMGEHSVNVFSNEDGFLSNLLRSTTDYVTSFPGWDVKQEPGDSPVSIIYLPSSDSEIQYFGHTKTVLATGKPEDYKSGQVLAYLGFWLMELQRQSESMFTVHSSALALGDRGVLLMGHEGAGKTSILLEMARKYDGEIISNDLTIIKHRPRDENMILVDGTKEIRLRQSSVVKRFPSLSEMFTENNSSPWENKVVVDPARLGLRQANSPKDLHAVFMIHLDSNENCPLSGHREEGISIRYRLYEDMSRIIRGNAISLFGADRKILGYTPSLDTVEIHQKRVAAIEYLVEDLGVWYVSGGNLEEVCEAIYEKV